MAKDNRARLHVFPKTRLRFSTSVYRDLRSTDLKNSLSVPWRSGFPTGHDCIEVFRCGDVQLGDTTVHIPSREEDGQHFPLIFPPRVVRRVPGVNFLRGRRHEGYYIGKRWKVVGLDDFLSVATGSPGVMPPLQLPARQRLECSADLGIRHSLLIALLAPWSCRRAVWVPVVTRLDPCQPAFLSDPRDQRLESFVPQVGPQRHWLETSDR